VTKAEARARVARHAAGLIGGAPANGDEGLYLDNGGESFGSHARKRLDEACAELEAELRQRAARGGR